MNATDLELLRKCILAALSRLGDAGLPPEGIARHCEGAGFVLTPAELAAQLAYLADKGLLCERAGQLSAGLKRYTLSPAGRACLLSAGWF